MPEFQGPKTVMDTFGILRPYEPYVKWLEAKVAELEREAVGAKQTIGELRGRLMSYIDFENRRFRYESDYVQQHDESEGRE